MSSEEAYQEAERRIAEVVGSQETKLDLSGLELETLPEWIEKLSVWGSYPVII